MDSSDTLAAVLTENPSTIAAIILNDAAMTKINCVLSIIPEQRNDGALVILVQDQND